MRPRTPVPLIRVEFRRYANANAQIRWHNDLLLVRLADTLESAPEDVAEALAQILLSKLFRRPVPSASNDRYRRYLNRRDIRRSLDLVRQIRGRKRLEHPQGCRFDLEQMFEDLNFRYFHGLMARPRIGWSPNASRTLLGHYDSSHNAIVLSRILDRPDTPKVAVEYVLFHEMLHLRYPAEHNGARRCVHTKAFKEAEKEFEHLREAKMLLRKLEPA
ncbi:MAG: SprT-like domain-containing protein [Bryobacterales bacterium]|nr:SprT-like domain-containing protein [Bryobacterales bacterium]MBV9399482.1 SprT-like domain-containing protein [Bryobacterales bacterium]